MQALSLLLAAMISTVLAPFGGAAGISSKLEARSPVAQTAGRTDGPPRRTDRVFGGLPTVPHRAELNTSVLHTLGTPDHVAGTRTGALNGVLWGVSRHHWRQHGRRSEHRPMGEQRAGSVRQDGPGQQPDDINMCDGQLVESANDSGSQTVLAMYPRQPFNFAGRTGVVEFNVSDNSESSHTAWPTFAITDQPIPDPDMSTQVGFDGNNPRNGIEVDFFGNASSNPHCVYANIAAVQNYQQMNVPQNDSGCVRAAPNKVLIPTRSMAMGTTTVVPPRVSGR